MYQPKSIVKQRLAPISPQVHMVEPTSAIMINLESITSANESQAQKEAETASVLSQFTPLSTMPMTASGDHFEVDRDRVRNIAQPSLHELSHEETASLNAVDFKPKRRGLWLLLLLLLVWMGYTGLQVGIEQFFSQPIRSTQLALSGQPVEPITAPEPQIEEVIEVGELKVTVSEVSLYTKGWILIEGQVENSTTSSQSEIKLKILRKSEKGATFQDQFICCRAPDHEEDRDTWLSTELARLKKSEAEPEYTHSVIPPQQTQNFLRLYKLPSRSSLPKVSVQVTWNEPISD